MRQSLQNRRYISAIAHACFAESMVCPHVITYMMAYALRRSCIMSVHLLFKKGTDTTKEMDMDNLTYVDLLHDAWMLMEQRKHGVITGHNQRETWVLSLGLFISFMFITASIASSSAPAPHHLYYSFCLFGMCWWVSTTYHLVQGISVHTYTWIKAFLKAYSAFPPPPVPSTALPTHHSLSLALSEWERGGNYCLQQRGVLSNWRKAIFMDEETPSIGKGRFTSKYTILFPTNHPLTSQYVHHALSIRRGRRGCRWAWGALVE